MMSATNIKIIVVVFIVQGQIGNVYRHCAFIKCHRENIYDNKIRIFQGKQTDVHTQNILYIRMCFK